MHYRRLTMTAVLATVAAAPVLASPPSPEQLVDAMVEAAGGHKALATLGTVRFGVEEQETLADGRQFQTLLDITVYMPNPDNARLEFRNGATVVRNEGDSWALVKGELDERPQAARMSRGTVNQKVFPMLLPFSLEMDGVTLREVRASTRQGRPTWQAEVVIPPGFFLAPSMTGGTWALELDQATSELMAVAVLPPETMQDVVDEGMRYKVLRTTTVDGVRLPTQILMEGITADGAPTGHNRIVTIEPEVIGPFDPTLFVHPERLEAIEEGDL